MKISLFVSLSFLALCGASAIVHADAEPLGLDWTASYVDNGLGATITTTIGSDSLSYTYDGLPCGVSQMVYNFETTAAATGTESIDASWSSFAAWFQAYTDLYLMDYTQNTSILLSSAFDNTDTDVSGSIAVNAGDTWGFQVQAGNDDSTSVLNGTLTLDEPAATPEPSSLWMLGTGLIAVMGVMRRKLRS